MIIKHAWQFVLSMPSICCRHSALALLKMKKNNKDPSIGILGLMTGTSCDGIDGSYLKFEGGQWESVWSASLAYPSALRERVLGFQKPKSRWPLKDILNLDRDLGDFYAQSVHELIKIKKQSSHGDGPAIIANHGQTVAHFPHELAQGTTMQLGDPSRISEKTGLTVVSHFRQGDMASGGQGAPLVPLFHQLIAKRAGLDRGGVAIHNLGGISNLTYLGPQNKMIAFDTGPGNVWIDAAAHYVSRGQLKMDFDGLLAKNARPDHKILKKLLSHPYFSLPPPKSTGRDDFTISHFLCHFKNRSNVAVATATELTITSIVHDYQRWILSRKKPLTHIFLCGGGAQNPVLVAGLKKQLNGIKIEPLGILGIDPQWAESMAFAYYGYRTLLGQSLGGKWTGGSAHSSPGWITPGRNWPEIIHWLRENRRNV